LKLEDDKEIYDKLIQAVKNSRAKGYHGQEEEKNIPLSDYSITRVVNLVS